MRPLTLSLFFLFSCGLVHSAEINFSSLTNGDRLVSQDGWVSIYEGAGGIVQAESTIPNYGDAKKVVAVSASPGPGSGQFAKANAASGLISNGVIRMDVLCQYQNGSPLHFAPAGNGITAAGGAADTYFGPQLSVGFLSGEGNQARLLAGGNSSTGSVRVDLPSSIGWLEWVWFRLELDCTDTATTGNVIASASYRSLSDGEETFTPITDLQNIPLAVGAMLDSVEDPATWTSVWFRHDNAFSTAGAIAAVNVEQVEQAPRVRDIWSVEHASLPTPGISYTSVAVDVNRIYAVAVLPDQSAHVYALDDQGNVLSDSQILGPAVEGVIGSGVSVDDHNAFSIAVDSLGYLHVTGNHHNHAWNYWISDAPRSAASFTDHSTEHDVEDDGKGGVSDINVGDFYGESKIGGWFTTYANFFRDNFGRLWLTSRAIARDSSAVVEEGSLAGLRGGFLAKYDPYNLKVWEPLGERAPTDGNSYRVPMITWDETGRASPTDEWYQAYRINLEFDASNDMHLSWIAFGSLDEGAPSDSVRNDGATHLNYMRRIDDDGRFLKPNGAEQALPADRWGANILRRDPGDLAFGSYVATGEGDEPFIIFQQDGKQYLMRRTDDNAWESVQIPVDRVDPGQQILYHPDVGLLVTDADRVLVSEDRGDTWEAIASSTFRHIDKAFFRKTGNLIGSAPRSDGRMHIHEIRFNNTPTPVAVDDLDYSVRANDSLQIAAPGVLGNDFHPEFLSVTVSSVGDAVNGSVSLQSDGSFTFTPDSDFSGEASFTYELEDSAGQTAQATAYVTVRPSLAESAGYEPFDLVNGSLGNGAGGSSFGFDGNWQNRYLEPEASDLTVASPSLQFNANYRGNRLTQDEDGTSEHAYRKLATFNKFSTAEINTRYVSFVTRVADTPTDVKQQYLYLVDRWGFPVTGFLRYDNNRILTRLGTDTVQSSDSGQSGQLFDPWSGDWLIVIKIVTHPTDDDVVYLKAYKSGDALVEPMQTGSGSGSEFWSVVASGDTAYFIDGIEIGIADAGLAFDEIRIGGSFEGVTSDIGDGGVSVFVGEPLVDEVEGNVLPFQFSRSDTNGPLSVLYSLSGEAIGDSDYVVPNGVVSFADGESVVSVDVSVIDDTLPEANEALEVTIVEDGAYEIANGGPAAVTISFNDLVELKAAQFNQEAQSEQTIEVTLHNPMDESLDFNIATEITQLLEYTSQTSDEVGGPAYEWIEISSTGTRLDEIDNNIEDTAPYNARIDLGDFSFPFYEKLVTELMVSPHGHLSGGDFVGERNVDYWLDFNLTGPRTVDSNFSQTRTIIAPMWSDWIVGDNSGVFYQQVDEDTFVVQYDNIQFADAPSYRATFQVVIKRSGTIQFNYKTDDLPNSEHLYTVAISDERPDPVRSYKGEFIQHYFAASSASNPVFVEPEKSVIFRVPQVWLAPNESAVTVPAGESRTFDLSFYTYAFSDGHTEEGTLEFSVPGLAHEENYQFDLMVGAMSSTESWRMDNFGHVFNLADAADLADPDGDSLINLAEYGFGTLPNSANSSPVELEMPSANMMDLTFMRAVNDLDYIVESSTTLESEGWTEEIRNPGEVGEMIELSMPIDQDEEFYRIRLERR